MILLTVVETFGKETTLLITLTLWFFLVALSFFLKKKIATDILSNVPDFNVPHQNKLLHALLFLYKYSFLLAHILLAIALCFSIAHLYLSSVLMTSLTVVFIFLSLAVFLFYLGMFLLMVWKKWVSSS